MFLSNIIMNTGIAEGKGGGGHVFYYYDLLLVCGLLSRWMDINFDSRAEKANGRNIMNVT